MLEKFRTETAGRSVGGTIRSSILRHVMRNGNFMVTEIAEATGYSLTTIAKYVAELQSDGMIAELERVNLHTKGRKAIRYGVNPDSYYFLGIDMKTFELNIALISGSRTRTTRWTNSATACSGSSTRWRASTRKRSRAQTSTSRAAWTAAPARAPASSTSRRPTTRRSRTFCKKSWG